MNDGEAAIQGSTYFTQTYYNKEALLHHTTPRLMDIAFQYYWEDNRENKWILQRKKVGMFS